MSSRRKIASLVVAGATAIVAGLAAAAPAQASTAADPQGVLRNAGTGLCLDWPGSLNPGSTTFAVTATCTGSKTQQWTYSEADRLIHNTGTGYCAVTANTDAVFVTTCADRWGEHWGYTRDGRFHQLDWTTGCMQDNKSWGSYVTWTGICRNTDIEVWQRSAS
jgi:ricin-type beta-trefoil lectin protein